MPKKILQIYDKPDTADRYTVVYDEYANTEETMFSMLAMSENPNSPMGFCQHTGGTMGKHLGKKIELKNLPVDCQIMALREFIGENLKLIRKFKRIQSCWPSWFGKNKPYKVIDIETIIDIVEPVLVMKTGKKEIDYELVYADEAGII
jgi:hypothetical protein